MPICNTRGIRGDVSEDIRTFLNYLATGNVGNELTEEINAAVDAARMDSEGRWNFMTLYERDQENIERGRTEGRAEGLAEGRTEGRAEGLAEGRAKGLAEGRAEGLRKGHIKGLTEGGNRNLYKLVSKGILNCGQACREAEPPVDEETFRRNMMDAGFTPAT